MSQPPENLDVGKPLSSATTVTVTTQGGTPRRANSTLPPRHAPPPPQSPRGLPFDKENLDAIRTVKIEMREPDPIRVPVNGEVIDLTIEEVVGEAKKIERSLQKEYKRKYKGDKLKMAMPHSIIAKVMKEIGADPDKWVDTGKREKLFFSFIITNKDGAERQTVEWAHSDSGESDSDSDSEEEVAGPGTPRVQETPGAGPSGRRVGGTVSPDRVMAPRSADLDALHSAGKRKWGDEADSNGGNAVGVQQGAGAGMWQRAGTSGGGGGTGGRGEGVVEKGKGKKKEEENREVRRKRIFEEEMEKVRVKADERMKQAEKEKEDRENEDEKKEDRKEKKERRRERKKEKKRAEKEKALRKKGKSRGRSWDSPPPSLSDSSSDSGSNAGSDMDIDSGEDALIALISLAGRSRFDPTSPDAIHISKFIKNTFRARVAPPFSTFTPDNLTELGTIVHLYTRQVNGHSIPDWSHPRLAFTSDDHIDRDRFMAALPNFMRCIKSEVEITHRKRKFMVPICDKHAVDRMQGAATIISNHKLAKTSKWDTMFNCFFEEMVSIFQGDTEAVCEWDALGWQIKLQEYLMADGERSGKAKQSSNRRKEESSHNAKESYSREEKPRSNGREERTSRFEDRDRGYQDFRDQSFRGDGPSERASHLFCFACAEVGHHPERCRNERIIDGCQKHVTGRSTMGLTMVGSSDVFCIPWNKNGRQGCDQDHHGTNVKHRCMFCNFEQHWADTRECVGRRD